MSLRAQVLNCESQLTPGVLGAWAALAPTPMQSPQWMLAWWDAYKSRNCKLQIVLLRDADRVVGIAPFYHQDSWSLGSAMRFLGSGHACTDFQTILHAPGYGPKVTYAIQHWLSDACNRGAWGYCDWDGVEASEDAIHEVAKDLGRAELLVKTTAQESTWRLDCSGGWDGVLSRMSKTQRRQSRNLINRFDKSDDLEMSIVESAGGMAHGLDTLVDLHQKRWEAVGKPGCFADKRFEKFLRASCVDLFEIGQCQIRILTCGGQPAAVQLVLCDQRRYYMYQTGRAPAFDRAKVGRMLTLASIRQACSAGAEFVDYLRGDEVYKSRLGAVPSSLERIRIVAPDARHRVHHVSSLLGRNFKRTVKSIVHATGIGRESQPH